MTDTPISSSQADAKARPRAALREYKDDTGALDHLCGTIDRELSDENETARKAREEIRRGPDDASEATMRRPQKENRPTAGALKGGTKVGQP